MKKNYYAVIGLLFFSFPLLAQISTGTKIRAVRPDYTFQYTALDNFDVNYQNLLFKTELTYGKFTKDNVATGWYFTPELNIGPSKPTWNPVLSIARFKRYYIPLSEGFFIYGEGALGGVAGLTFMSDNAPEKSLIRQEYGLTARVAVGATYFYKRDWAIEARTNLGSLDLGYLGLFENSHQTDINLSSGLTTQTFQINLVKYINSTKEKSRLLENDQAPVNSLGERYISGNFTFRSYANRTNHQTSSDFNYLNLGVSSVKFVSASHAKGYDVGGGFSRSKISTIDTSFQSNRSLSVYGSLFHEYYMTIAPHTSLFISAGISAFYAKNYVFENNRQLPQHLLSFTPFVNPGIQYRINNRWAVAATVGSLSLASVNFELKNDYLSMYPPRNNSFRTDIKFSPVYQIGNSGISIRYFMK